jgi:hypothetical protein
VNARLCLLALATAAPSIWAAPAAWADDEADALLLADKTVMAEERVSPWRVFGEGAVRESTQRSGTRVRGARASIDVRYDKAFAPGWRAAFADRLDAFQFDDSSRGDNINTLKEAYLTWQPGPERVFEGGRINARQGVATGYNPTDYFKAGAVRSVVSVDPASLRENRMGTAMLRGQALWAGGSVSGLYAPKLVSQPSASAFSPDFGATNDRGRWLVSASHRLAADINPQWLLYGEEGRSPQFGANLTALASDATVVYLEWSGGRSSSLRSRALGLADDSEFRSRASAGATYTTFFKLSLTAEYQYNGAGLDRPAWEAVRGSPAAYGRYRSYVAAAQELPTRENLFLYASWQDALVTHLDLALMQRRDLVDNSRLSWIEARYRFPRADVALQWQLNSGSASSNFGALQDQRVVQALARYYFD